MFPVPGATTLDVYGGEVRLPKVIARAGAADRFLPPPALAELVTGKTHPPAQRVIIDQLTDEVVVQGSRGKTSIPPDGSTIRFKSEFTCKVVNDTGRASVLGKHSFEMEKLGSTIASRADCLLEGHAEYFDLTITQAVTENQALVHERSVTRKIKRNLLCRLGSIQAESGH